MTAARPLSYVGSPVIVNVANSLSPSAGTPAGFVSVAVGCAGACATRPLRPATTGRVDGLTAQLNRPPRVSSDELSRSRYSIGSLVRFGSESSTMTGEVSEVNCLRTVSCRPCGALP